MKSIASSWTELHANFDRQQRCQQVKLPAELKRLPQATKTEAMSPGRNRGDHPSWERVFDPEVGSGQRGTTGHDRHECFSGPWSNDTSRIIGFNKRGGTQGIGRQP